MKYHQFHPRLTGLFLNRFHESCRELEQAQWSEQSVARTVSREYDWATADVVINGRQRKIYRAVWLLVRDLTRVGWDFRYSNNRLEVAPPNWQEQQFLDSNKVKNRVRNTMAEARRQKITESRDFIQRMECPPLGGQKKPISYLIADGKSIASALEDRTQEDGQVSAVELRTVIRPYLQLVTDTGTCSFTGHKLLDIWRYFRYTWATPYETTPGRTMMYLIRDEAQPNHPIMGLASLENSPIGIADRDEYIGWTADNILKTRIESINTAFATLDRLLQYLEDAIGGIRLDGLCDLSEVANPTNEVIERLRSRSVRYGLQRRTSARFRQAGSLQGKYESARKGRLEDASDSVRALYQHKRATQLVRLLQSKKTLLDVKARCGEIPEADGLFLWTRLIGTDDMEKSVRTAVGARKSRHVGTSIMELNVCGAIPPYNHLLAGKLTALMMLSPQVVSDYRARYSNKPSEIASLLKGEPVTRPAELVYIGTTSLYSVGSSQYNRLKLPAKLIDVEMPEIPWKLLGETRGYGSLHISKITQKCLDEVVDEEEGSVTRIFGDGPSPKLRHVKDGIESILERDEELRDSILKHSMTRLIYGAWLAVNGREYLLGTVDAPRYYFGNVSPIEGTDKIIEYWMERWLLRRAQRSDVLQRLRDFDRRTVVVSNDFMEDAWQFQPLVEQNTGVGAVESGKAGDLERDMMHYVRKLYRGSSGYADNISRESLEAIHIPTPLDRAIVEAISEGKDVVLTGNPGDGKTHLLRMLADQFEQFVPEPVVEYDASAVSDIRLYEKWKSANETGRSFCVAINEAVLFGLADTFSEFAPLREARDQVLNAISYSDSDNESMPMSRVVVFDLSRRNVLSESMFTAALDKILAMLQPCERCSGGCDFVRHGDLLKNPKVRSRIQHVLNRVSRRGYHATVREMESLISYLVLGDRSCDELLNSSGEDRFSLHQLMYSGVGSLFDVIRETFDPATVTHPIIDDELVYGETGDDGWITEPIQFGSAIDSRMTEKFHSKKRAFFLYHMRGNDLANLSGDTESDFAELLSGPDKWSLRQVIRMLNVFFGEPDNAESLRVWQSHRFNHSARKMLVSLTMRVRTDFELVHPRLRSSMRQAFESNEDHVLLRLKSRPQVSLKIDYELYEVLSMAHRGVPVMIAMDSDLTRRIWTFMDNLWEAEEDGAQLEPVIALRDSGTGETLRVQVDVEEGRYLSIEKG